MTVEVVPKDQSGATALLQNLAAIEHVRESYWLDHPVTSPTRLRWRAMATRHALHIAPGESVLEVGAGSGLWTEHLISTLRAECPITAAVFNASLAEQADAKDLPSAEVFHVNGLHELLRESFDCVVGAAILSHDRWEDNLAWLHSLLRPGGRLMFFEANYRNPQVFAKARSPLVARWSGHADCQIALDGPMLSSAAERLGFIDTDVVPYDILHPRTPRRLVPAVQSCAFFLEHTPGVRRLCGTLLFTTRKPSDPHMPRRRRDLIRHDELRGAISVVVPCHNESSNIAGLVAALFEMYDDYIREIVLVNDNSTDDTEAVARSITERDRRVRLINRTPPPGVGRALREGYAAATGEYILSMDCDFEMLVPELRDLFEVVAAGHEGAVGSRFSHESILLNYPLGKMIGNRAFHILVRLVLHRRVRDISNNLKLYRAEVLQGVNIEQDGFAANAETGLGPLLDGRDIVEVPIAWINRDSGMGESTFRVIRVAPGYALTLVRILRRLLRRRLRSSVASPERCS
jgi:dolichol-phosphate mannosyltransferase